MNTEYTPTATQQLLDDIERLEKRLARTKRPEKREWLEGLIAAKRAEVHNS